MPAPRATLGQDDIPAAPAASVVPWSTAWEWLLAAIAAVAFTAAFVLTPWIIRRPYVSIGSDLAYAHTFLRSLWLLLGGACLGWLLQPSALRALKAHRDANTSKRLFPTALLLALVALGLALTLIALGRRQFGGWDFNILIDVGWRQLLGQRPYVDFVTPTPPFFNWTAALAFQLFGVTWDANLYLAAIFSACTFLWAYFLLRPLGLTRLAAVCTAALIQIAAMLTGDFWWYNNTTLVLAALFFLASLLLSRVQDSGLAQGSFVLLLGVLPLTKPNVAGVTVFLCVALLLVIHRSRGRVFLLTLGGLALAALFFAALHVSVPGMIASYRGVARERGGFSTFGYEEMELAEKRVVKVWMFALCLPLLAILAPLRRALASRQHRQAAFWLFFPAAALVAIYGTAGNGEFRDVELTLLIPALALLAFVYLPETPYLRRATVALFCGMALCDLYVGLTRLRVFSVGAHKFFEWTDNNHRLPAPFFAHLHTSGVLSEVDHQVREAVQQYPGPTFFGPRLDFEYAALHLPEPVGWTTFFQPGTSFSRADTAHLLLSWREHRFPTLIFMKDDYTFYPKAFLRDMHAHYAEDDHFTNISVYHRRPGS